MRKSKSGARRERRKRRAQYHWQRMLRYQLVAYAVVAVLWLLPIPNPVKLLAVTFHEFFHGLAAVLTGGRVFGFAIAPGGSGVTMGVGGNLPFILVSGYVGSCLWGTAIYFMTVKWQPNHCLIILEVLMIGTALFGWLNEYTAVFGGVRC